MAVHTNNQFLAESAIIVLEIITEEDNTINGEVVNNIKI